MRLLMEGTPDDVSLPEVTQALEALDDVADAHHVHAWALSLAAAFLALAIPRVPRATSPVCAMRDGNGAAASQVNSSLLPATAPAGDPHASARQAKRHTGASCVKG